MHKDFTVADFFCGAGGFSEGFRQAGFKIIFAMDNWEPARKTYNLNHPESHQPIDGDILSISPERINDIIPDVDIIIGSPPCVNFSSSNNAGKADKKEGITLIKKFLQIVAVKKHKSNSKLRYWLMENVPNSRKYIQKIYTFNDLGLNNTMLKKLKIHRSEDDCALIVDTSNQRIHNSVHFGIPQKRERFITGEFPEPKRTTESEESWRSLGDVLNSFRVRNGEITDPLYGFHISESNLTDHFYDTEIPRFEWEEAKVKKQQARYYGRMSFPEDEKRPARTIMATRSIVAREAMIFSNGKPGVYRAPTIREVASIMSFPINYLFDGKDEATKYKLVGNAVCPMLAYSFAKVIIGKEGLKASRILRINYETSPNFNNLRDNPPPKKKPRPKHHLSNFCEIVPDMKMMNFRVELDNSFPKMNDGSIGWRMSVHHATGNDSMKKAYPNTKMLKSMLIKFLGQTKYDAFRHDLECGLRNKIPDAKSFQELHCNYNPNSCKMTPRDTLLFIKTIADKHFRNKLKVLLPNIRKDGEKYICFDSGKLPKEEIPLGIVAAAYGVSMAIKLTK